MSLLIGHLRLGLDFRRDVHRNAWNVRGKKRKKEKLCNLVLLLAGMKVFWFVAQTKLLVSDFLDLIGCQLVDHCRVAGQMDRWTVIDHRLPH